MLSAGVKFLMGFGRKRTEPEEEQLTLEVPQRSERSRVSIRSTLADRIQKKNRHVELLPKPVREGLFIDKRQSTPHLTMRVMNQKQRHSLCPKSKKRAEAAAAKNGKRKKKKRSFFASMLPKKKGESGTDSESEERKKLKEKENPPKKRASGKLPVDWRYGRTLSEMGLSSSLSPSRSKSPDTVNALMHPVFRYQPCKSDIAPTGGLTKPRKSLSRRRSSGGRKSMSDRRSLAARKSLQRRRKSQRKSEKPRKSLLGAFFQRASVAPSPPQLQPPSAGQSSAPRKSLREHMDEMKGRRGPRVSRRQLARASISTSLAKRKSEDFAKIARLLNLYE